MSARRTLLSRVAWGGTLALAVAALAARAWHLRFVCDDAHITFRYARNLLEGHGLVFNPGEWVEGYTNFLWLLEVAALWAVGVEPATGSLLLSAACTAATLVLTGLWAARIAPQGQAQLGAWMAVVLLCSQRGFAEWTTSGLETRQFTLLVLAGLVALAHGGRRWWLLGSAALGLATLTRPEGALVMVVGSAFCLRRGLGWRDLAALALPFGALVGAHLAFRMATYGALVPNTYVAKHVGPWPEMGARYLGLATVSTGLYLVVPLAVVGVVAHARREGWAPLGGLAAIAAHAAFLVRIGGDHFAFRPLDWWWPLLAAGCAAGLILAGQRLARASGLGPSGVAAGALVGFGAVVVYASAFGYAEDRAVASRTRSGRGMPRHLPLRLQDAPALGWLSLGWALPRFNEELGAAIDARVAVPHHVHRRVAQTWLREFSPYLGARSELELPPDAVASRGSVGIMPFCLPDLEVIDELGLTDATIARTPPPAGTPRRMAHERRPPPGYLEERGVTLSVEGAAASAEAGLAVAGWALQIREDLWMPFDATDAAWVRAAFAERPLVGRTVGPHAASNTLTLGARELRGTRVLASFEAGEAKWRRVGRQLQLAATLPDGFRPRGVVGQRFAHSIHPEHGLEARGTWSSPPFEVPDGAALAIGILGDGSVEIEVEGAVVHSFRGIAGTELRYAFSELDGLAGQTARVRIVDDSSTGFVAVDHVVLLRAL